MRPRKLIEMVLAILLVAGDVLAINSSQVEIQFDARAIPQRLLQYGREAVIITEVDKSGSFSNPILNNKIVLNFTLSNEVVTTVELNSQNDSYDFVDAISIDSFLYVLYFKSVGNDAFFELATINEKHVVKKPIRLNGQFNGRLINGNGNLMWVLYQKNDSTGEMLAYIQEKKGEYVESRLISRSLKFNGLFPMDVNENKCVLYAQFFTDSANVTGSKGIGSFALTYRFQDVLVLYDLKNNELDTIENISLDRRLVFLNGSAAQLFFKEYLDTSISLYSFENSKFVKTCTIANQPGADYKVKVDSKKATIIEYNSLSHVVIFTYGGSANRVSIQEPKFMIDDVSIVNDKFCTVSHYVDYQNKSTTVKLQTH